MGPGRQPRSGPGQSWEGSASNSLRARSISCRCAEAHPSRASIGSRAVLPSDVIRYSTAIGRLLSNRRSINPLRSRRRRVADSDFCETAGIARRSSLKRHGASHSSFITANDHLSKTCPSSSRWASVTRMSCSRVGGVSGCGVTGMAPSFVEVTCGDQVDNGYLLASDLWRTMTVTLTSPAGLLPGAPYHHVATATGARHVYVAGQVAHMPDGAPIPTDLAGQVAQALRNVARALEGAGATFADVARLTVYVTQWQPEKIGEFMASVEAVASEIGLSLPMPPASLIGVQMLFEPEVLVEIEATAVLD